MEQHPSLDFAAAWRAMLIYRPDGRLTAAADLAFWESYAATYDSRTSLPDSYAQTLAVFQSQVRAGDTLLDVGAGTGRFALPLAPHVAHVTALDPSPAMLTILREKAAAQGATNLTMVEAGLEDCDLPAHDVVLAAWSLYRQLDLPAALTTLVRLTRRTLIIAASDAAEAPHQRWQRAIWGRTGEPDFPAYLYMLGALRQIGIRADLRIVWETRRYTAPTAEALVRRFVPPDATAAETTRFAAEFTPALVSGSDGWHYHHRYPVGLLIWHANADEGAEAY